MARFACWALLVAVVLCGVDAASAGAAAAWRIVNSEAVEVAWRIRSVQFFSDDDCSRPLEAVPNATGSAFASEASEMTGAEYAFALRSPRGWESVDACAPGACHLGFEWTGEPVEVRCVLLQQGDDGFHAGGVALQSRPAPGAGWAEVVAWAPVESGRAKLAMACPSRPEVAHAAVDGCRRGGERAEECVVYCEPGYGTVEPRLRCVHGAWYSPECLPVGTLFRVVARAPELIQPYWVVLHAVLYVSDDCTDVIRMEGSSISSGEYVIKYANYHPQNVWDGDAGSSWASKHPCSPGSCWFGFRFKRPPGRIGCVRVEHPEGRQYQASEVAVETLGASGWEALPVTVQLLPEAKEEL